MSQAGAPSRRQSSFAASRLRRDEGGSTWSQLRAGFAAAGSRAFGADLRSLAVFRVVLGVVVLLDLIGRVSDARTLYSDEGIFLRTHAQAYVADFRWSLMFANGTVAFAYLVFLATTLTAIAVILGYRTRLMVIILWVLVISIQTRNPYHLFGADTLIRSLLFWGMFLPLGAVWSLDSRTRSVPAPATRFLSVASVALFLQIAFMYWFTMLLKSGNEWRSDFDALWWTFGSMHLTSPFGHWLQQFPTLLIVLTVLTLIVEGLAPFLLFSPVRTGMCRMVGVVSLMGLHLGILLTLTIGIFPAVSALCMVCFLPTAFWDAYLPAVVRWVRGIGVPLPTAPQWSPGTAVPALVHRAWSAVTPSGSATLSFAMAGGDVKQPGTGSDRPPGGGSPTPPVPPVGKSSPRLPLRGSLAGNLIAAIMLLLVLGYNISTVSAYRLPAETRPVTTTLGLYQNWSMFAPSPPKNSRWHLLYGTTANGDELNLLRALTRDDFSIADPMAWEMPNDINSGYYGDIRWRRYLGALDDGNKQGPRARMATYVCNGWNARHPDNQLVSLIFIYAAIPTTTDGSSPPVNPRIVSTHTC